MIALDASYQTGLQLLMAANSGANANGANGSSNTKDSGTNTATNAGATSSSLAAQNKSASADSTGAYSSASTIAALKAIESTASGPMAGVMAAIVNSLSNSNDYYGNECEADNAAIKANESLTSQQISDTLLSGGSLVQGLGGASEFNTMSLKDIVNTLSMSIAAEQSGADLMSQWVQDGMPSSNVYFGNYARAGLTPDQIQQIISQYRTMAAQDQTDYAGMTAAMANGTLKIQRATDVQGLDFVDGVPNFTEVNGLAKTTWTTNETFNNDYLQKNASNGYLTSVDGVGIYLSW